MMHMICKCCGIQFDYDEESEEYSKQAKLINSFMYENKIADELAESWDEGFLCLNCAIDLELIRKKHFEIQKGIIISNSMKGGLS